MNQIIKLENLDKNEFDYSLLNDIDLQTIHGIAKNNKICFFVKCFECEYMICFEGEIKKQILCDKAQNIDN